MTAIVRAEGLTKYYGRERGIPLLLVALAAGALAPVLFGRRDLAT
jgi:hypothetical protein